MTRLIADDRAEESFSTLEFWSKGDYLLQWQEGTKRIAAGVTISMLVKEAYSADAELPLRAFCLYHVDDKIIMYEMIFNEDALRGIDMHHPYGALGDVKTFVQERRSHSADESDGEWEVSVDDFLAYGQFLEGVRAAIVSAHHRHS